MRIVFSKYYNFLYPVIFLLSKFGFKVNYLKISDFSFFKKNLNIDNLADKLKKIHVYPLPIEDIKNINSIQSFIHDLKKKTFELNILATPDKLINEFSKNFKNIKNINKKIRITLQKDFGEIYINQQSKIEIWNENQNDRIIFILPASGIFLNFQDKKIKKFILPFELFEFLKKIILRFFSFTMSFVKRISSTNRKEKLIEISKNIKSNYLACYFFHHGRSYSNLFEKDIYFEESEKSYLNKKNMLFIDYTNSLQNKNLNEYNIDDLISERKKFILKSIKIFSKLVISSRNLKSLFSSIMLVKIYYNYLKIESVINKFPKLRECYFANDITSPKEIFLVLESKQIKSICHQDRFLITFCNTYPSNIADEYYCISNFTKDIMTKSNNYCPNIIKPYGFWKLSQKKNIQSENISEIIQKEKYKKIITVLGHTTNSKWYLSKVNPYNSWNAQNSFLSDVLKIASYFPDYKFILRFKDLEWTKNNIFHEKILKIEKTENIEISKNYTFDNYSFFLCKKSDLIIGKYTSLIDECMYIGIPCIILDYNHQTKNIISECFNYGNSNIFCQSKEDVINKVKILSENKNYFDINKEKFFSKN